MVYATILREPVGLVLLLLLENLLLLQNIIVLSLELKELTLQHVLSLTCLNQLSRDLLIIFLCSLEPLLYLLSQVLEHLLLLVRQGELLFQLVSLFLPLLQHFIHVGE